MLQTFTTLYFSCLGCLALIVCIGWYLLGTMNQVAFVLPIPTKAPSGPRFVFRRRGNAIAFHIAHLAIVGKWESSEDTAAVTIALQVT